MRRNRKQFAVTLLEMLTALAIILLLTGLLAGLGKKLKLQSQVQLTESTLSVLALALEQYHEVQGAFPPMIYDFDNDGDVGDDDFLDITGIVVDPIGQGAFTPEVWNSGGLHFFLDREPKSRSIIKSLDATLMSNLDDSGQALRIFGVPPVSWSWIIFRDPWDHVLDYRYNPLSGSFPLLVSAGKDGLFDTEDDITSQ